MENTDFYDIPGLNEFLKTDKHNKMKKMKKHL